MTTPKALARACSQSKSQSQTGTFKSPFTIVVLVLVFVFRLRSGLGLGFGRRTAQLVQQQPEERERAAERVVPLQAAAEGADGRHAAADGKAEQRRERGALHHEEAAGQGQLGRANL